MKEHRGKVKPEEKVLGRQRIDKALRRGCERVGVPYLRHHDLRHYFSTKATFSPELICQRLQNGSGMLMEEF